MAKCKKITEYAQSGLLCYLIRQRGSGGTAPDPLLAMHDSCVAMQAGTDRFTSIISYDWLLYSCSILQSAFCAAGTGMAGIMVKMHLVHGGDLMTSC